MIAGGSNEVLRTQVAERGLGLPRGPRQERTAERNSTDDMRGGVATATRVT